MTKTDVFPKIENKTEREEGSIFAPEFDAHGLLPVIVTSAETGEVLMFAYMNEEALRRSIETGEAHYWSRSRNALWRKGETSGNTLAVAEMRTDCDQDAILMKVSVAGNGVACHRGYRSCFYRKVPLGTVSEASPTLAFDEAMARTSSGAD